jgi:hypothetical protein
MKLFNLQAQIYLPFEHFRNLGSISGSISAHTAWELEHTYYSGVVLDIDIRLSVREHHAGFEFTLGLLGYGISFRIYDTRHWDYDTNAYSQNLS